MVADLFVFLATIVSAAVVVMIAVRVAVMSGRLLMMLVDGICFRWLQA